LAPSAGAISVEHTGPAGTTMVLDLAAGPQSDTM
jgi:hypothetical protein